jgi:hypothetical protein
MADNFSSFSRWKLFLCFVVAIGFPILADGINWQTTTIFVFYFRGKASSHYVRNSSKTISAIS